MLLSQVIELKNDDISFSAIDTGVRKEMTENKSLIALNYRTSCRGNFDLSDGIVTVIICIPPLHANSTLAASHAAGLISIGEVFLGLFLITGGASHVSFIISP